MEFHEAANIFPLDEEHLDELAKDIKEHGLRVPIETLDGLILDGRRRWMACQKIGVEPMFRSVDANAAKDPATYVLSLNLHRRQLDASQRAMVAARVRGYHEGEAKKRQAAAGERGKEGGRGKKKPSASVDAEGLPPRKAGDRGRASTCAGRAVDVSAASVDRARNVIMHGSEELVAAVDKGDLSLVCAETLAKKFPKTRQTELVAEGKKKATAVARRLRVPQRQSKRSTKTPEIIAGLLRDIRTLMSRVQESTIGLAAQRERALADLRLCRMRVQEACSFLV
ncbi:MAG TPA: ParB/Srx family N-terminal domain-containing protein [Thermoguttaceae bacterium]|nr:ParB/Srx family N-terminal domain-containing protein [Thermoguttaceae bacterium]